MFKESCITCLKEVSDPVCAECYINQTMLWLKSYPVVNNIKRELLQNLKMRFVFDRINEDKCILC